MTRRPFLPALLLTLTLPLLGLSGCVGPSIAPAPPLSHPEAPETLTRRLDFVPFKPDAAHRPQTLLAVIRLDDGRLRAVITTPTGQRLLTLEHDAQGARFTQQLTEPPFPAAWLASRLEWGLWPRNAFTAAWQGSAWRIVTSPDAPTDTRQTHGQRDIYHGDRLIARIDYRADGSVLLDDCEGGYRLTIAPLGDQTP